MAAKKERDESERIKETNKFEDRTRDKAKEDRTRDKAKEDRTRYKGKEDKSETRTISTEHKFDDDMMLSPISDVQGLSLLIYCLTTFENIYYIF